MHTNINYVKVKREKHGTCNVCGKERELSWDHVPPKGSIFSDDVELRSIFNKYEEKCPKIFSQNGTKFRSICKECNNLIGSKYDVEFNNFVQKLTAGIFNGLDKINVISTFNNPSKIVRALFGHLLASKSEYQCTKYDKLMRTFIFSEDISDPEINIYYWFFPYRRIEIMRDYGRANLSNPKLHDFFSLLKMYPISFYLTENDTYPNLKNFRDLCIKANNDNTEIELDISMANLHHYDWPILIDDSSLLIGHEGNNPIISRPRMKL